MKKDFAMSAFNLCLIQCFTIWQMGIIYYSTSILSLHGDIEDATSFPIVLGYLAGTVLSFTLPVYVGVWSRALTIISFILSLSLFFSLSSNLIIYIYFMLIFCCVTFISAMATLTINIYSLDTVLKDGIISTLISAPFIGIIYHISGNPSFTILNIFALIIQLMIFVGLRKIPLKTKIFFSPKGKIVTNNYDKNLLHFTIGTFVIFFIICMCVLFSSTTVESIKGGISIFYFSAFAWTVLFIVLVYKFKLNPFDIFIFYFASSAIGYILWLFPSSSTDTVSIILQSSVVCISNLAWLMPSILFEKTCRRYVAPLAVLISLLAVILHSVILDTLRNNPIFLLSTYGCLALILLIIFFILIPYFKKYWNTNTEYINNSSLDVLTTREKEIVSLLIAGFSTEAIANHLVISNHTVKTHVKNIYYKLNVHSRFQLMAKIRKND